MDLKPTHAGVAAVFLDSDSALNVLGIRGWLPKQPKQNNQILLPKGHIEEGETPLAAALRELREEAGVECNFLTGGAYIRLGVTELDYNNEHCVIDWWGLMGVYTLLPTFERLWWPWSPGMFTFSDHQRIASVAINWAAWQLKK